MEFVPPCNAQWSPELFEIVLESLDTIQFQELFPNFANIQIRGAELMCVSNWVSSLIIAAHHPKIWGVGASSNGVSIICPLFRIGLTDLPKTEGHPCPPPPSSLLIKITTRLKSLLIFKAKKLI